MGRNFRGAALLLTFALLLSGCWDHLPLEEAALILGLGLDVDPEDDEQVIVTQLVVIPGSVAASGESSSSRSGTPFYLLTSKGTTMETALIGALKKHSRLPTMVHLDALVFGHDFARLGRSVEPAASWALINPKIRPGTFVFVADVSAQYFLDAHAVLDPLAGEALTALLDHSDRVPFMYPVRLYEFIQALLTPGKDAAVPYVGRADPASDPVPPHFHPQPFVGQSETSALDNQAQLIGMAIFKGSRMIGLLTEKDGNGIGWLYGGTKATVSIPHPDIPNAYIVANTLRSKTKRSAKLDGDQLVLTIEITASMDAWGMGTLQPMSIKDHRDHVDHALADAVEKDVRQTMERLQELKADIFGFGEELYRSSPKDWEKVADVWDDLYATAKVDVRVDVKLKRTGYSR